MSFGLAQRNEPGPNGQDAFTRRRRCTLPREARGRQPGQSCDPEEQDESVGVSGRGDSTALFGQPVLADQPEPTEPLLRDVPVIAASQDNHRSSSPEVMAAPSNLAPSFAARGR